MTAPPVISVPHRNPDSSPRGMYAFPWRFHRFSPLMRQVALREWCLIAIFLLSIAVMLGLQNGLGRLDQTLYDRVASLLSRPARDDIIIVSIDDYSLSQLGRWPW